MRGQRVTLEHVRLPAVPGAVLAAAVFVAVAVAATGIVHASGRELVDTGRYQEYADAIRDGLVPYRDFDAEYPPGALPVFLLPELVTSGEDAYFWAFVAEMAVVGAIGVLLVAAALSRLGRPSELRRRVLALVALSPALFGGVLLTRFDLVPAALVAGTSLLLLADRHRAASVTLGAAAAVKLYPLVLVPLVVCWTWRRRGRREAAIASTLTAVVVGAVFLPFAIVAPAEVASSVWGQLSRPLQIESLGAGLLLLLHHAVGLEASVEGSRWSHDLAGAPATGTALALSVASMAAVAWLWIRFARGGATPERLVRFTAAVLVALVALGRVLSPQFLVWLTFPLALVAGRRGAAAGACFAVAALATAVWFPALYFELPRDRDPAVASLVVLRGLALVSAFLLLAWPRAGLRRIPLRASNVMKRPCREADDERREARTQGALVSK